MEKFLGEEGEVTGARRVAIVSAPLASTVSWQPGTDKGPAAIIAASPALEIFDDELLADTWRIGIDTLPPLALGGLASIEAWQTICATVAAELAKDRLVVTLGGEHSVTVPAVAAHLRRYPRLHVLQIDAHLDLRDDYEDNPLSHACVMRRLHDLAIPFTQVGIRSFSRPEWELVRQQGWQPFTMDRIESSPAWQEDVVAALSGPVYVTIDVDGLDPAIMPATGTPEPGGLSWRQLTGLLRKVAAARSIVGLDIVELAPIPGAHHASFTVAKLLYRTLGYIAPQLQLAAPPPAAEQERSG